MDQPVVELGKDPGGYSVEGVESQNIQSWSVTVGTVDYIGTYFQCYKGSRCIDMDGTPGPGAIEQTFATVPGKRYRLTFAMGANPQGPPEVKELLVTVADRTEKFSFDVTKETGWRLCQMDFVATSPRTTVLFKSLSLDGNYYGALLDYVSVMRR